MHRLKPKGIINAYGLWLLRFKNTFIGQYMRKRNIRYETYVTGNFSACIKSQCLPTYIHISAVASFAIFNESIWLSLVLRRSTCWRIFCGKYDVVHSSGKWCFFFLLLLWDVSFRLLCNKKCYARIEECKY